MVVEIGVGVKSIQLLTKHTVNRIGTLGTLSHVNIHSQVHFFYILSNWIYLKASIDIVTSVQGHQVLLVEKIKDWWIGRCGFYLIQNHPKL